MRLTEEAVRVHGAALVIDGRNDLPNQLRKASEPVFRSRDLARRQRGVHIAFPRFRRGGVGVQVWAARVPPAAAREKASDRQALEQIDLIRRMVRRYADTFELTRTTADDLRARKQGRIASLISRPATPSTIRSGPCWRFTRLACAVKR